uniref:Uncharacterized protein n=1 Tax=Arundo donax TaxID=35708 RepID=A0A0A8ZHY1_ARUDO
MKGAITRQPCIPYQAIL